MLNVHGLPYVTADLPGIGGRIKADPQDFEVEEIPLYEASGEGTHVYFQIEKQQLTTMQAVQQIARALGVRPRDIGYAGLKDAAAVSRQMLSIEHIDPQRVEALSVPRLRVLNVSRHRNKLKLGHLAGNRFRIKLREVDVGRIEEARAVMDVLVQRGAPNYFGPQRFGVRGDTWLIGRAILLRDHAEAMALMLGRAGSVDYGQVRRARELFDRGEYEEAARTWPYPFNNERRICFAVAKYKGNFERAFRAVDVQMRRFFVSACQSQLFNQAVARRIDGLDQLMPGDLAWLHVNGAVFRVLDLDAEQPRCTAFEISPTGPLFGARMTEPAEKPLEIEQAILAEEDLKAENFGQGPDRATGGRRPLRFQPREASLEAGRDAAGEYLEVCFALQAGSYATVILREIIKSSVADAPLPVEP